MLYRTFTTREKVLFVFFGILLVGAVYYFLVFRPVTDQKTSLQNIIYSQQDEINVLQPRFVENNRMKEELKTLPDVESLKPIAEFDNVRGVMEFLNTTMAVADDFSITFANVEMSEDFARRNLAITFTCTREETAREIIDKLFDAPYRSQAKSFNMTYNNDGAVSVNMSLTFYEIR